MKKIVDQNSSFEEIYNEFHNSAMNWISFKIKNKSIAEELANDVLIKVFKNLEKYNPEISSFNTWVCHITNMIIIDHYRTVNLTTKGKANKANEMIDDSLDFDNAPVMQVPDTKCIKADSLYDTKIISENTLKAFESLKGMQKKIAVEFFINELNYNEIVEALNVPIGTVKASINRVKEKLQSKLKIEYSLL